LTFRLILCIPTPMLSKLYGGVQILKNPKSSPWVGIINNYADQMKADGKAKATIERICFSGKTVFGIQQRYTKYKSDIPGLRQ